MLSVSVCVCIGKDPPVNCLEKEEITRMDHIANTKDSFTQRGI
jgi:hypothetical protein